MSHDKPLVSDDLAESKPPVPPLPWPALRFPLLPNIPTYPELIDPLTWPEHGSRDVRGPVASSGLHTGERLTPGMRYDIIRCISCQFIHAVPLPDEDWLADYYSQKFYTESKPEYRRRYEEDKEWWTMHHAILLSQVHNMLGTPTLPQVLDVGCGPGLFLDTAQSLHWVTSGFELDPSLVMRNVERGHRISQLTLAQAVERSYPAYQMGFDVVSMYEVLEHMPDPVQALLDVRSMLCDDGILIIVVPNDYSPLQFQAVTLHGLNHYWVSPPEHLNYFTPVTLKLLLLRTGWDIIMMRGTFPLEYFMVPPFFWDGLPQLYVGNDDIGRIIHKERQAWETNHFVEGNFHNVLLLYEWLLTTQRIGREIVVFAKKK